MSNKIAVTRRSSNFVLASGDGLGRILLVEEHQPEARFALPAKGSCACICCVQIQCRPFPFAREQKNVPAGRSGSALHTAQQVGAALLCGFWNLEGNTRDSRPRRRHPRKSFAEPYCESCCSRPTAAQPDPGCHKKAFDLGEVSNGYSAIQADRQLSSHRVGSIRRVLHDICWRHFSDGRRGLCEHG